MTLFPNTKPSQNVSAAPLSGRRFQLRPIYPDDYRFLYQLAITEEIGFRWKYRGAIPSYETFVQGLVHEQSRQFLVVRKESEERCGLLVSYGADLRNGHAYVGIVMAPQYVGTGLGIEPLALFVNYLFATWNFRKLYSVLVEFNYKSVSSGLNRLFKQEGLLRSHEYYHGQHWDQHILALYREDWEHIAAQFLPAFLKESKARVTIDEQDTLQNDCDTDATDI